MAEASPGDKVLIKTEKGEEQGILVESYEPGILLLKLKSGYNIGIKKSEIKNIKVVEKAREDKEEAEKKMSGKPIIDLIMTGGTISSSLDVKTGGVKPLTNSSEFFKIYPEIFEIADVRVISPFMKLSENMDSGDWIKLAKIVKKSLNDKNVRGVIVTHGTDFLHYTAAALSFILKKVPKGKILAHYRKEHHNNSYRNHYMLLPKSTILDEEKLSAIGFFDAEGTKTRLKKIEVVNCEPELINLFIQFLEYFKIKKEYITYRIIFNKKILNNLNKKKEELEEEALGFWMNNLRIPKGRIRKFNYVGQEKGAFVKNCAKYGSLNINYNSVLFCKFMFSLIDEAKKRMNRREEITAYLRGYLAGEAYVGSHDREIQFASKDMNQLNFAKSILERMGIKCSISKATSTSPTRIIITNLESFLILESLDIFKFHPEKRFNLISKILNYKKLNTNIRSKLKNKLSSYPKV